VFNFSSFGATSFGYSLVVAGLTMAVVGGIDSWLGAAIGAIIVVWFPSVATFANGMWTSITYGVLVIVVVSYEPGGIFGLGRRGFRSIAAYRRSRLGSISSGATDPPPLTMVGALDRPNVPNTTEQV
jgi:hypothetical protein